jgi:hypothetical protein
VHIPNHHGAPPQPPPRFRRGGGEQCQRAPEAMIVDFLFFDSTFDLLLVLTIIPFFQIDSVESVSCVGQSTPS